MAKQWHTRVGEDNAKTQRRRSEFASDASAIAAIKRGPESSEADRSIGIFGYAPARHDTNRDETPEGRPDQERMHVAWKPNDPAAGEEVAGEPI